MQICAYIITVATTLKYDTYTLRIWCGTVVIFLCQSLKFSVCSLVTSLNLGLLIIERSNVCLVRSLVVLF